MATRIWKKLLCWLQSMEGSDDPAGAALLGLEQRVRSLESEVRIIRAGLDQPAERTPQDGIG